MKVDFRSSARVNWLDVAKGIGILLVIAGHTIQLGWSYPIYAFHLPLFLIVSGMLIDPAKIADTKSFLLHKAKRLLIPWCIYLSVSFAIVLMVPSWSSAVTLRNILIDLYTLNTNFAQNSSLWYLPCLFLVFLYFAVLQTSRCYILTLVIVATATLLLGWLMPYLSLPTGRFPLKADSAMIGVFFLGTGYWGNARIRKWSSRCSWLCVLLIATIAGSLCILNGFANINAYIFGRCALAYYPIAIIGAFSVLSISNLIGNSRLGGILAWFGKNSLIIFCFQSLFIRAYWLVAGEIAGKHFLLYGANPVLHQVGAFLLVSLIISPLLVFASTGCKQCIGRYAAELRNTI